LHLISHPTMPPVAVRFSEWLAGVSLPGKYGLIAALILCAYLFNHIGRGCLTWSLKLQRAVAWRRLLQSRVPNILHRLDVLSYAHCVLLAVLLASNIIVLVFAARSVAEIQKRAGAMAVISLFPLFAGPTFSQTSSLSDPQHRHCRNCPPFGVFVWPSIGRIRGDSSSSLSYVARNSFNGLIKYRRPSVFSQCCPLHLR
jgi:hypothetical protein